MLSASIARLSTDQTSNIKTLGGLPEGSSTLTRSLGWLLTLSSLPPLLDL